MLETQKRELGDLMDFKKECFDKKSEFMKEMRAKVAQEEKALSQLLIQIEVIYWGFSLKLSLNFDEAKLFLFLNECLPKKYK